MDPISLGIILESISTIVFILVGYYAYCIYTYNQTNKTWLFVIVAFVLLILRRVIDTLLLLNILEGATSTLKLFGAILVLLSGLFLLIGIKSMLVRFESFKVLEHKTDTIMNKMRKKK